MSPDPVKAPSLAGLGEGFISWGIPIIAGAAGFIMGDFVGVSELVDDVTSGFLNPEGPIPLSDRLDFSSAASAGVYGVIALGVVFVSAKIGAHGGMIKAVIFRTVIFWLGGTAAHLVLAFLLPRRVLPTQPLIFPAKVS